MRGPRRRRVSSVLIVLVSLLALNCNTWTRISTPPARMPAAQPIAAGGAAAGSSAAPLPTDQPSSAEIQPPPPPSLPEPLPYSAGEPAGCLSAAAQDALPDANAMLGYASSLVDLKTPFGARLLPNTWNGLTSLFTWQEFGIISLDVSDVANTYVIQRMLNALQVAGFVTWLRAGEAQGLHILAIPLRDPALMQSNWAPYVEAYWRDRNALPPGDDSVRAVLKLPPCAWMVERGFAPRISMDWWATDLHGWPDYAAVSTAYYAATTREAEQVASRIDWLGADSLEGPDTMCGPLAWAIMHDAQVFPPGWGAWLEGPRSFWLAKPEKNGRPWSLFPRDSFLVYRFSQPLGEFDFREFPLYPGDFLYTYAFKDGFDHMLVVTEVDANGDVYTVSNLTQVEPQRQTTIERTLLFNFEDTSLGIARNKWARDKINGRTGHAGFEVFRWSWMQKDIDRHPAAEIVQPGDTIGLLAARWKTPAELIAEYNEIVVDTPLAVGQQLMIPPNQQLQALEN